MIDVDATVEEALAYGKDASLFEKNSMIKKGVNHEMETVLVYYEIKISSYYKNHMFLHGGSFNGWRVNRPFKA